MKKTRFTGGALGDRAGLLRKGRLLLAVVSVLAILIAVWTVKVSNNWITVAMVNFQAEPGRVQANGQQMELWIREAIAENADVLLFPELAVCGILNGTEEKDVLRSYALYAESSIAPMVSYYAVEHDMWIIFGGLRTLRDDEEHFGNAAFVCGPDGSITAVQKLSPLEGERIVPGNAPLVIDAKWGKMGVAIGSDCYDSPELVRYYAAQGCSLILSPSTTAVTEEMIDYETWLWKYQNRLDGIADRDGVFVASANLISGEKGVWPYGGSMAAGPAKSNFFTGITKKPYIEHYIGHPEEEREGMFTGVINLARCRRVDITGLFKKNFQPELYADWYTDLAVNGARDRAARPARQQVVIGAVDFQAVWNDKQANLDQFQTYVEEAGRQGVNILVFPELALTGYARTLTRLNPNHMQLVNNAVTTDSPEIQKASQWAAEHNMYIIFGAPEVIPDSRKKAYNSVFVCSPDGRVDVYRKIHNVEGSWYVNGGTPLIVETEYGAMGISVCKDTYAYPELQRYYAAKGCTFVVNPTATGPQREGGAWVDYYRNRLENLVDRDHTVMISANLGGEQNNGPFPGGSCVLIPYSAPQNGTGADNLGYEIQYKTGVDATGLRVFTVDLSAAEYRIGFDWNHFRPEVYADLYSRLAAK